MDNTTVVLFSIQKPHFMRNNLRILSYQFVFEDAEDDYLSISHLPFLTPSNRQCKKTSDHSPTNAGMTRYGKCPLFTVGTKEMHCVEGDNSVSWEEDRSGCVKKMRRRDGRIWTGPSS